MTERQVFMFHQADADPLHDRVTIDSDGIETLLVWVPDASAAARVADDEAHIGAGIIELYRGFDAAAAGAVLSAVGDRAAVGFAMYPHGAQSAARISRSVTIFRSGPGAGEPVTREHPDGSRTVVVGSPDPASTVALARQFVADGFDLVEICGGEPLSTAARVGELLGHRASVSYVAYPYDSLDRAAAYKASFADADG